MSLMEIMCGFVPLLQPTTARLSQEDPLGQRYTAVTTATTVKSVLTVGGDAVRYATYYRGEKADRVSITLQFVQLSPPEGATVL